MEFVVWNLEISILQQKETKCLLFYLGLFYWEWHKRGCLSGFDGSDSHKDIRKGEVFLSIRRNNFLFKWMGHVFELFIYKLFEEFGSWFLIYAAFHTDL